MQFGLRPLHCACKWGNIFGVEWLVSHGANINEDDACGRTSFSFACASSVDTMKKMLYLEKQGCHVRQYDIFIAAENKFASSEQAHEVFHHLVNEKGMSINVTTHVGRKGTPLRCACFDGSVFGVKWLISHGANIETEPYEGIDLYEVVCKSSVDTLKKILILEERGYDVSPRAIFLSAEIQFASCEEACEVLHHLVYDKKMSVNATDAELDTPLHCACKKGSFFVVKWLVEHNATINSVNKYGITPLMCACESDSDRLLKVRYLSEKGAECLMTDKQGETALFYGINYFLPEDMEGFLSETFDDNKCERIAASKSSISEGVLKEVLRYLVIKKGMNINSVNKVGMTPLLHACNKSDYPLFAVRQLLEVGADVTAKDSMSRNALHLCAKAEYSFNAPAIDFLIEKGIDATCRDKDGKAPYQLAEDGKIRMRLRQHYDAARFSVLRQEKVRPDSIKVCVVGSEMAGKTTLVNSLLRLDLLPIKLEDRTAGVAIKSGQIPGVGKGSIWDFGAQPTFHSAHGLFFGPSNTMFVLVLRFREGERMTPEIYLLEIGRYWCAFVKAALRMLPSHLRSRLRLLIIGNVIDCREEEGTEASFQLKRVAEILQEEFKDTFKIVDVLEMDCNGCYSVRMADCRRKLKRVHEEMLEAADGVPKLCRAIEEKLRISNDESESPFMTSEEFKEWAEEVLRVDDVEAEFDDESNAFLTEEDSKISIEYLDSSGIIVNLGPRICLRPLWLCSNVIGPLLAPRYFPFGMKTAKPGMVTRQDIESALRAFENYLKHKGTPSPFSVTANEATEILLYLELCIRSRHIPGFYQIPALLEDSIPGDAWVESPILDVYRGMRYECADCVDIILPLSFVVFQSRSSRMGKMSHEAWKDGVKLRNIVGRQVVECLVTLGIKKSHCCIDVIMRWSSQTACHELAKQMLNELKEMIVEVCEERSPGVLLNWFYLDSTHLKRLNDDPAIYSSIKVDQKVRDKAIDDFLHSDRPKRRFFSSVRNLAITGEIQEERPVFHPETMLSSQGPSGPKRRAPDVLTFSRAKRLATSHHRVAIESEDSAEMASRVVTDRLASLASPCEGLFPTDNDSVSADLVKTCAVVAPTKWEEIGYLLTDLNTVEEIRERTNGNVPRMIKVLETWKLRAKTPTVRKLLKWFEEVGVAREAIKKKYLELY
ncbi:death-associated protein kinase 1-like [Oscarella lobularis]|uniref:death-associated protein kinase 1-like n=1 Tax=Oscarella lobularis TaxID=121494 RepID=UPI00331390F9